MEHGESARVLVVDDEANLRKVLSAQLRQGGYEVTTAANGQEALDLLGSDSHDVMLTDLRMPELDGMSLLSEVRNLHPRMPVVVLTAHGTVDTAVNAMKMGAFDYLTKPFDKAELELVIGKAARAARLSEQEPAPASTGQFGMVGQSPALAEVFETLRKVADSPSTVLITGESGTGKELIAKALHEQSSRTDRAFIKINCAALPRDLIESELFGYQKGAFTGAVTSKPGRFELAHEGTLFLDEIGLIPPEMQAKLLRALQESEFERVGGIDTLQVDVRLIAATNLDLESEVAAGRFREDLFYRLNVVPLKLPPLRERRGDIPFLVDHFLARYRRRLGRDVRRASSEALELLVNHAWPGNIRELENVLERAVLFSESDTLHAEQLPEKLRSPTEDQAGSPSEPQLRVGPLKAIVKRHTVTLERDLILRALEETGGNVTRAARRLEISRKSLQNKMRDHGLRESTGD
ncbi:MAG: sigma-54 dependent transcriptional regulator [Myxococcota bacterium]